MAKITIDSVNCKGCGLCVKACPKKVIQIGKVSNGAGYFTAEAANEGCTGCISCAYMCPDACITVER